MMKKIRKILTSFALALLCLFMCLPCSVTTAYADGISVDGGYTSVLDDLRKDEQFSKADYSVVENNYTLQVITISESVGKELFVYVYQPHQEHGKYVASSINISATSDNSLDIMNYPVSLVSFEGVFQKYLVTGITLPTSGTRYYDVISIYRVFDGTIDKGLDDDNDNTISEVVFKVGKLFTLTDTENGVSVNVNDTDVITVTEKYVGFMRYPANTYQFGVRYTAFDVHYVAFSTDKVIEDLLEADIYYKVQSYSYTFLTQEKHEYGEILPEKSLLTKDASINVSGDGWFSTEYKWNTIERGKSFVDSEHAEYSYAHGIFESNVTTKMTDEELAQYIGTQDWVLRFAVTEYDYGQIQSGLLVQEYCNSTIVSDVTILRLKFETDDIVYNLGVVDNKQTGSLTPDNEVEIELAIADWVKMILFLLGLILVCVVLGPVLPLVFGLIGGILKLALKIVTFPFRLLFGGRRR